VIAPIRAEQEWAAVREFAKAFCTALAEADPGRFTVALRKDQRRGRIFLDYLRNQRTATAILPYSARARDGAPVAAPVTWQELAEIEQANAYSIGDAAELRRRAERRELREWGRAEQGLPVIA
jgi:bifunctional non-homologous end joining protein LigD